MQAFVDSAFQNGLQHPDLVDLAHLTHLLNLLLIYSKVILQEIWVVIFMEGRNSQWFYFTFLLTYLEIPIPNDIPF